MDKAAPGRPVTDAGQWLRSLASANRGLIRRVVIAGVLAGFFTVVQMGLLAWIVHAAVVLGESASSLLPWFVGLLAVLTGRAVAQGFQSRYAARCSHAIRAQVRQQQMAGWEAAGPVRLLDTSAATLAREWLEHVEALHGYFARFLPQMLLCLATPLMVLAVVVWLDWLAAVFLILSAPLIPLFMALVGMGAEKLNQQHFAMIGRLSGQFLDRVRGLTTLQIFGQAEAATETIRTGSDQYRRLTMKTLKVAFLSSAVLEIFASVAIAVVAMYVGFGLLGYIEFGPARELNLFSGLFILLLAPEFFQPLRQLSQHYHDRAAALGAAGEILRRLNAHPAPTGCEGGVSTTGSNQQSASDSERQDHIDIHSVEVRFANGRLGLKGASLTIAPGESIALTGPSGGGKSTLLHVLAGFIEPSGGHIRVFGETPGQAPFGWLGQAPFMMHGTWADNLRMTTPGVSDAAIEAVLRKVGLGTELDTRSAGIHSSVSEDGAGLSGGQARRLTLARIFLSDVDLILLDEPTEGLDPESERLIVSSLEALKIQGKTLIFATHHATLLGLADRVITVTGGHVIHA